MKIHNIRLGFATNSSSTHSIVIVPASTRLHNSGLSQLGDGDYGWCDFTLINESDKLDYLSSMLYHSLVDSVGKDIAKTVAQSWTGGVASSGIDHQSIINFPLRHGGKSIHKEFFDEFKQFILKDNVAILGGNDNSEAHEVLSVNGVITADFGLCQSELTCRKESGYWVLFNRDNGAKIRVSFDQPIDFVPKKAKAPELVDIKITDYCPFNCSFCYQNSTVSGSHAQFEGIARIADCLGEMEVFEVAIGGGEPTMHPDFVEVLKLFKQNNIVPNFTTKSTKWLRDKSLRNDVLANCGSFAFSVTNGLEAKEIVDLCNNEDVPYYLANLHDRGLVFHYVIGTGTFNDFKDIIDVATKNCVQITLLGYKTNGRGASVSPHDNSEWLKYIINLHENNKCPMIGIDTKLADDYKDDLNNTNIPKSLFTAEEGKFSMYVDAVNGLVGPSSYCDKKDMKIIEFDGINDSNILCEYFNNF